MLGGVPDDEADEIRELLSDAEIDYYEVPASFLGVSPASLWLHDSSQLDKANALIGAYQIERTARARSEYEKLRLEGQNKTMIDSLLAHPLRALLFFAAIIFTLYWSLAPFLNFGK